jgi:aryl-alcohol dehydrogenase-like predicted oxidoreductase
MNAHPLRALQSISAGWNVIDTAANYRGGRAETAVGRALRALRVLGDAERDQLFVSTKAGYPPGGWVLRGQPEHVIKVAPKAAWAGRRGPGLQANR